MCRVLRVSSSGFYAWRKRGSSVRAQRDAEVLEKLRGFHERSDGTYGAPRLWKDLREEVDIFVGQKRVARLMRAAGLMGVSRRRGIRTTRRGAEETPAADLVRRDFTGRWRRTCGPSSCSRRFTWRSSSGGRRA